jgi:hypothetical protein
MDTEFVANSRKIYLVLGNGKQSGVARATHKIPNGREEPK